MAKKAESTKTNSGRKVRPALTPEARENQLISLAMDRAEEMILDKTASSQIIVHFLKLGSTKERIEKEMLEKQKTLIDAKTENLNSGNRIAEIYEKALDAMRKYSGQSDDDEY